MRTSLLLVVALTMIVAGREVRWADHHYRISNGARNGLAKHAKAVKEEKERRKMMSIENTFGPTYYLYGDDSAHWTVNGEAMNYADVDCGLAPGWVQKLDTFPDTNWDYSTPPNADPSLVGYESVCSGETTIQDAPGSPVIPCALICLPVQAGVSGPSTQSGSFILPAETTSLGDTSPATPLVLAQEGYDTGYLGYGYAAPDPFGAGPICETFIDDCKYSTAASRTYTDKNGNEAKYPRHDPIGFGDPRSAAEQEAAPDGTCSKSDSKTQWLDCGIPCPAPYPHSSKDLAGSFGVAVIVFVAISAIIGVVALIRVGKASENYFVAGRSLNLFVVVATLGSQSLDANAALGNLDLGYNYHWWDGACLPIGLGASLIFNAIFFAAPLNKMKLLTLPDLMARKFGSGCEIVFSILSITSFLCLLAGNLVGAGKVISHLFFDGSNEIPGIWICAICVWLYTVAGGLFSVAYTDIVQACLGWIGMLVGAGWIMNNMPTAAPVSPAYPLGDKPMIPEGMSNPDSYDPIPNAIMLNWATVIVLAFGNLGALDFQARVFAAKGPKTAVIGCLLAGCITFIVGITFSYISGSIRALYGPSSPHAEFVADSCSRHITILGCFGPGNIDTNPITNPGCTGVGITGCDPAIRVNPCNAIPMHTPTCGEWKPDPYAPLKLLTCTDASCHSYMDYLGDSAISGGVPGYLANFPMNGFIGGWVLIAIMAASMSTGDGAILAMSTVLAHNILEKFGLPKQRLLFVTRLSTLFWALVSAGIASAVPGKTALMLIVAFDIMLAGCVIPMFAAVYWKSCKPMAAFVAMITGSLTRLILQFALPHDELLLLVGTFAETFAAGLYEYDDFKKFMNWHVIVGAVNATDYGTAGMQEVCPQRKLEDWTGVDSLVSPVVCLLTLLVCQLILPDTKTGMFAPIEPSNYEKEIDAEPTSTSSAATPSAVA